MKKYILVILLLIGVSIHGQYVIYNDFQLKNIELNHVFYSFTITSTISYMSHQFYLDLGFTKEEAKYYAMFTGIVAGLIYEYVGNYRNNPTRRESKFMGIGLSLIVMRW